jgi:hypothetical protein
MSALLLVCVLGALQTGSAITGTTVTYQFVGQCTDCTGTGVGLLTLQNYTLGTALANSNFVSFSYSSNLLSFSLTQANSPNLSGTLPATLPAQATVLVDGFTTNPNDLLWSHSDGSWCAGSNCTGDNGSSSTWGLAPSVPALRLPMLIGLAAMLALAGVMLLKLARRRVSA